MAYTKTVWVNREEPAINATNLNKMEVGIDEAHDHMALTAVHGHARTHWTPNSITVNVGTPTGTVNDIKEMFDGNLLQIQEAVGIPGIDAEIGFTNIDAILNIIVMGYYDGSHHIDIELYDYVNEAWRVFTTIIPSTHTMQNFVYVQEYTNFISEAGAANMRLYHDDYGNPSDYLYLGYVALAS